MVTRGKNLGPLVVASYVNTLLYMLEIVMVWVYWRSYRNDRRLIKAAVLLELFVGFISMLAFITCIYLYAVVHWGDQLYLDYQHILIAICLATTGVSGVIVQTFMVWRYWTLSSKRFMTALLLTLTLLSFTGDIVSIIVTKRFPSYSDRARVVYAMTTWLTLTAVLDVATSVSLICTLKRVKPSFIRTKSTIDTLIALSVSSGGITSIVAVAAVITYLQDKESNVGFSFASCLGRVYALTMLYNLNLRKVMRKRLSTGRSFLDSADLCHSRSCATELDCRVETKSSVYIDHRDDVHCARTTTAVYPSIASALNTQQPLLELAAHHQGDGLSSGAHTPCRDVEDVQFQFPESVRKPVRMKS